MEAAIDKEFSKGLAVCRLCKGVGGVFCCAAGLSGNDKAHWKLQEGVNDDLWRCVSLGDRNREGRDILLHVSLQRF